MTAKHTPGPWVADDNEGFSQWSIWGRMAPSGHGTPGRKVAVVDDCSGHSDADAQLIAAAPELLEALQFLITASGEQLSTAFEQAQAAIAKATGEQT